MYESNVTEKSQSDAFKMLEYVYGKMPETKGCMEHISLPKEEGGCNAWCCREQNPSVFYSEFLYSWTNVRASWENEKVVSLVERALINYLYDKPSKGCIFFDTESNMCSQHEHRPHSCREYGIVPDEEFRPRYERLRVLNNETKYQCQLVETADGSKITPEMTKKWWKDARQSDIILGVPENNVSDEPHGSYRTYHDHLLLHLLGEENLAGLSVVRLYGEDKDKKDVIEKMLVAVRSLVENESRES